MKPVYRLPYFDIARRRHGQCGIDPPGTYRDPIARSAPPATAAIRSGRTSGSCERSASIWQMTSYPRAIPIAKPALLRAAQHLDLAQLGRDPLGDVGGAVGAVVVQDEDVGLGQRGAGPPQELLDVLRLDVGGRAHLDAHQAPSPRRASAAASIADRGSTGASRPVPRAPLVL